MKEVLAPDQATALLKMNPVEQDEANQTYDGQRASMNSWRRFANAEMFEAQPVFLKIANAFQDSDTVKQLATTFGTDLNDTYLRIEYAMDSSGFWLEPHTDIGVKMLTMLVYLSDDPDAGDLGTSIYLAENMFHANVTFKSNSALVFVPSPVTWHGF